MATTLQNRYVIDQWPIYIQGGILVMVALLFHRCAVDQPYRTFNWTGIRPAVKDTVQLIRTYGMITSAPPRHSYPRHWLMQQATEAELVQLLVEQVFHLAEGAPPAPPEHQTNLGFTELELNRINDIYHARMARKMDYLHQYHD